MSYFSEASKNSNKVIDYFEKKYCNTIGPIGLLKCCCVVSSLSKYHPRLNVMMVAPTRQFKTQSSNELKRIFSPKYYIDLGSDYTIHGIYQQFCKPKGQTLNKKCLITNDMTLLLSSKGKKAKDRLINAFAELSSEGIYYYKDNLNHWELKGFPTFIMNITSESYEQNKKMLSENTFLERFLAVHYHIKNSELKNFLRNKHLLMDTLFNDDKFDKLKDYDLKMDLTKFSHRIADISEEYSILNFKSPLGMFDIIEALLKSHACFNERTTINEDDFEFIKLLKPYLEDPFASNNPKIVQLYLEGKSQNEICILLGHEPDKYRPFVSRVIKLAKMRGLVSIDKKENG